MATHPAELFGFWQKSESPACAADYPATLRFDSNGLYWGEPAPPAQFAVWDVGTWRIGDSGKISISTANDAVVEYAFEQTADVLTFTDSRGCRFSYRRAER